jgi:hypothetical protein
MVTRDMLTDQLASRSLPGARQVNSRYEVERKWRRTPQTGKRLLLRGLTAKLQGCKAALLHESTQKSAALRPRKPVLDVVNQELRMCCGYSDCVNLAPTLTERSAASSR